VRLGRPQQRGGEAASSGLRQKSTLHLRRYAPFYVFAVAGLLIVSLLPTVDQGERGLFTGSGSGAGAGPASGIDVGAQPDSAGDGSTAGTAAASAASAAAGAGSRGADTPAAPFTPGKTRGGFDCGPGVRQLPWSRYAAPCIPVFNGNNGGATWRGVSADKIRIVFRRYNENADTNAIFSVATRGGIASPEVSARAQAVMFDYLNKTFELYGRKVELVEFRTNSNPVEEANGRGREQACADATRIAEELKAFAVLNETLSYGPFSECAAERGLVLPIGAYGFPEEWYERRHPYVYGIQMNCTRIMHQFTEYVAKRLNGRQARWAGDATYVAQKRKFGVIRPDIEAYFPCHDLFDRLMAKAGVQIVSDYRYVLDVARLPAQMNQAAIQFKAAGVTSILLSADFLTMINLTQAAEAQRWGPEWVMAGVGFQDLDHFARLYSQGVVDGHMFGQSQLGEAAALIGNKGEPAETYRRATGSEKPQGTEGFYFSLLHAFNLLQAAGPNLNPRAVGDAAVRLPQAGGNTGELGRWSFSSRPDGSSGVEHTAVKDAREVYWDGSATAADGGQGTFVTTLGGRRFTNSEWGSEEPPVYPGRR
jgi:hypothetical protein